MFGSNLLFCFNYTYYFDYDYMITNNNIAMKANNGNNMEEVAPQAYTIRQKGCVLPMSPASKILPTPYGCAN